MPPATPSAGTSASPASSAAPARPGPARPDALAHSLVGEFFIEKKQEREAEARSRRPTPPWRRIASILVIVACGATWLVPSLGPRPAPAVSAAREDAGARLTLFLASQRVRDFEQRNGRLPSTATESGISDPRIGYRLTGPNTFTLSMTQEGKRWFLPSTVADTAYMRDAMARLAAQPK